MKKHRRKKFSPNGEFPTYYEILVLLPYCTAHKSHELIERLKQQPCPATLCGKEVPENLMGLSYGSLDDLHKAANKDDIIGECYEIIMESDRNLLMYEDANKVFGFFSFVERELDKINKLFSSIHASYSNEEEMAGVRQLDFGSFGILDWYAKRMGITNQNDVRSISWVRIYQCLKNDNAVSEYERRLQRIYSKSINKRR